MDWAALCTASSEPLWLVAGELQQRPGSSSGCPRSWRCGPPESAETGAGSVRTGSGSTCGTKKKQDHRFNSPSGDVKCSNEIIGIAGNMLPAWWNLIIHNKQTFLLKGGSLIFAADIYQPFKIFFLCNSKRRKPPDKRKSKHLLKVWQWHQDPETFKLFPNTKDAF